MSQDEKMMRLLKEDRRFTLESYRFVNSALLNALKQNKKEEAALPKGLFPQTSFHLTGQELCCAVRDYALDQFGMLARTVLSDLGIKKTGDIGDIVFNLLEIGEMTKTDDDKREDFDDVFNLAEELENGFRFLQ